MLAQEWADGVASTVTGKDDQDALELLDSVLEAGEEESNTRDRLFALEKLQRREKREAGLAEKQVSRSARETTCIVCFSNPKSHVAGPCGHLCACGPCSARMESCPICRAPVLMWMQLRVA